jgi:glycerophosphoryl diester phosphodiesterase
MGVVLSSSQPSPVLIIGHRGASGHRPEHTLESYRLAIEMGAGAIEPDLVSTKDGVLVARHENEIGGTTDVADRFPARKTSKQIDGKPVSGWFTEDFTLAELRTLRARERLAFRSHQYDGQFGIPTFEDVLDLATKASAEAGRSIAVYPETKHPTYFRSIGLPLEERLVAILDARGLSSKTSPVFVQSFEPSSLERLRPMTSVRLMQLLDQGADASPNRLKAIVEYADIVGPNKLLILPEGRDRRLLTPTHFVQDAHAVGLLVHVWTMRSEPTFLSPTYGGDPVKEVKQFVELGVDGIFTDFPDVAVRALK